MLRMVKRFEDMSPSDWAEHDLEVQAAKAREDAEAAAKRQRERIDAMGIPARALAVLAGKLDETDARRLIRGDALITILSGSPGTGKTISACEWLLAHERGLFVKAASLGRIDRAKVVKLHRTSALVIDDLGTEFLDTKGFLLGLIDELIDHRYEHRLPLVVTTNLDVGVFRARYGERLLDRVREVGRFVVIGGPSMRKRP